jgi:hypothetical protein
MRSVETTRGLYCGVSSIIKTALGSRLYMEHAFFVGVVHG